MTRIGLTLVVAASLLVGCGPTPVADCTRHEETGQQEGVQTVTAIGSRIVVVCNNGRTYTVR